MNPADVLWWHAGPGVWIAEMLSDDAQSWFGADRLAGDYMDIRLALWRYRNARTRAAIVQIERKGGPPLTHNSRKTSARGKGKIET